MTVTRDVSGRDHLLWLHYRANVYSIMDDTPKTTGKFAKTVTPSDSCHIPASVQDLSSKSFDDSGHLGGCFPIGEMVATGQRHPLSVRHDGSQRVQRLRQVRRAALTPKEHRRRGDLGVGVQAQADAVKVADLPRDEDSQTWEDWH